MKLKTKLDFNNAHYEFIRGSDIVRDGMFLELNAYINGIQVQLAEIFFSDEDFNFYLSCHEYYIPLPVMEALIAKAKELLPPKKGNE